MTLATCPSCAFQADIEAFFADDDGKRLAAVVADMPPECARAVLAYLRLFKPAKTGLRMARAVKLAGEVAGQHANPATVQQVVDPDQIDGVGDRHDQLAQVDGQVLRHG